MNSDGDDDGDGYPKWLSLFLRVAAYFKTCSLHPDSQRNECDMFCTSCMGDPFCFHCTTEHHSSHSVIQVRKSLWDDVVMASDIQKFINISGIQTFIHDKDDVVFLNEWPHSKHGNKGINACLSCHKAVEFPSWFCSIGCKLNVMRRGDTNISLSSTPRPDEVEDLNSWTESGESSSLGKVQKTKNSDSTTIAVHSPDQKMDDHDRSSSSVDMTNPEKAADPFDHRNARKRKGTPRRAPRRGE